LTRTDVQGVISDDGSGETRATDPRGTVRVGEPDPQFRAALRAKLLAEAGGEYQPPSAALAENTVRSSPVMVVCDESGRLVAMDAASVALIDRPATEMIGQSFLRFVHPDDRARSVASYFDVVSRTSSSDQFSVCVEGQWRLLRGDGSEIHASLIVTVCPADPAGRRHAIFEILPKTRVGCSAPSVAGWRATHRTAR
jgi:PAS domain-containing protein